MKPLTPEQRVYNIIEKYMTVAYGSNRMRYYPNKWQPMADEIVEILNANTTEDERHTGNPVCPRCTVVCIQNVDGDWICDCHTTEDEPLMICNTCRFSESRFEWAHQTTSLYCNKTNDVIPKAGICAYWLQQKDTTEDEPDMELVNKYPVKSRIAPLESTAGKWKSGLQQEDSDG